MKGPEVVPDVELASDDRTVTGVQFTPSAEYAIV
jgi:hypothetical protein